MRQLGRKTMQRSNGTFVEVGSVEDIFKVCCCLDVMVQEDKGTYCGGEPDWRQLDDAELEEVLHCSLPDSAKQRHISKLQFLQMIAHHRTSHQSRKFTASPILRMLTQRAA
jgi:hypothetical protein